MKRRFRFMSMRCAGLCAGLMFGVAATPSSADPGGQDSVISAYLHAVLGDSGSPSTDDIKNILESVGEEVEDDRIEQLVSQTQGQDITNLIEENREPADLSEW